MAASEPWLARGMSENAGNLVGSWNTGKDSILNDILPFENQPKTLMDF